MTICENCGISFYAMSHINRKFNYCSEHCRKKIYANRSIKSKILKAIDNNSFDAIKHLKLAKILNLGFEIKIKETFR